MTRILPLDLYEGIQDTSLSSLYSLYSCYTIHIQVDSSFTPIRKVFVWYVI